MLLAVIAWLVAVACITVGALRLHRVLRLADGAAALVADLRKARRAGQPWSDSPEIARELGLVLSAGSPEESVAALNERLGEVARELSVGAEQPRAVARIGLFSGTVLAVLELARTVGEPGGVALGTCGAALLAGISASAVGFELDRRSRAAADRTRDAWNSLTCLLTGKSGRVGTDLDAAGGREGRAG